MCSGQQNGWESVCERGESHTVPALTARGSVDEAHGYFVLEGK
jgi:hypothetical protein